MPQQRYYSSRVAFGPDTNNVVARVMYLYIVAYSRTAAVSIRESDLEGDVHAHELFIIILQLLATVDGTRYRNRASAVNVYNNINVN